MAEPLPRVLLLATGGTISMLADVQAGGAVPQLTGRETETVQRFVRAVLDHSATIGVRGEFTREYLATLGFGDEHVDVVGCTSLYRDGADLQITKRATAITPA